MTTVTSNSVSIGALPLEKRRRALLLEAAEPITGDPRIEAGIRFCPIGCDVITAYGTGDICYTGAEVIPTDNPDSADEVQFGPFNIAADVKSPLRWNEDVAQSVVRQRMSAMESYQVASELTTGALTGNASLQDSVTHMVAAVHPVDEALFIVEDILKAWENVRFHLHASPGLFSLLTDNLSIDEVGDTGVFQTDTGHTVIGDAGYDGNIAVVDPDSEDPVASAANAQWLWATLPVHAWLGAERVLGQGTGGMDVFHNQRTQVLERPAIVAFDPCVVVAIQVEVPTYIVATA